MRLGPITLAICAVLWLAGCPDKSTTGDKEASTSISGVVRDSDTGEPIANALVTLQATSTQTSTAPDGSFALILASGSDLKIVGASEGYYSASVVENSPARNVEILLEPVILGENTDYSFVAPETCAGCHPNQEDEWNGSAMANAGINTWVHDIYDGNGTPGGAGGFVYTRDSLYSGANPDSECAACHQPESWVAGEYSGRMEGPDDDGYPSAATRHGVSCEACHKIADVDTEKIDFPGIFLGAVEFNLPDSGTQVQYGSLPDVDFNSPGVMEPSYQPQLLAEVCGVCHQDRNDIDEDHTFAGITSEPTYTEWAQSPYGDPLSELYQTCVDCHMPPSGQTEICSADPVTRDPNTVRTHAIEGTTPAYLDNAVDLSMQTQIVGDELQVGVTIENSLTGHHVPTGVTIRNMILLVEAWEDGQDPLFDPLVHTGTQTVHDLGGSNGNPEDGYYAGLPGKFYAKVNHDRNMQGPTFFTDATGITFDNRIPALGTDATSYTFDVPGDSDTIHVRARLIYRRAFRFLVDAKGWTEDGHGNPLEDVAPPHYGHLMEIATADLPVDGQAEHTLSVVAGAGGAVISSPAGIDCPRTFCSARFDDGEAIVLTATPDAGNTFSEWTGDACTLEDETCALALDSDITVTAVFTLQRHAVTVTAGPGGSVTSSPAGIDCPGTCSAPFDLGTSLTLTAFAESTHDFGGWTGAACAAQGAECTFEVAGDTEVAAGFLERFDVVLSVVGLSGQTGAIVSTPAGISCPPACAASFANGETVGLVVDSPQGFSFSGWSGACSGSSTCQLTMSQDRSATATFTPTATTFSLDITNGGNGSIHTGDGGIDCGGDCSEVYDENGAVSLIAIPNPGFQFDGWVGGPCDGTSGTCNLSMTSSHAIAANFSAAGNATCANSVVTYDSGGTNGYGLQRVLEEGVAGVDLAFPTSIAFLPGNGLRFLVTEQFSSDVHYYAGGCTARNTINLEADLGLVIVSGGEQGLLDVTLHPDFENNGFVFFYYTSLANAMNSITRVTMSIAPSGEMVLSDPQRIIDLRKSTIDPGDNDDVGINHNGGQIVFAPDGTLLASTGDGGGSQTKSQDDDRLMGKVIRIQPSLAANVGGYTIPSGNMFSSSNEKCDGLGRGVEECPEILAKGLRNPFRMTMDGNVVYLGNVGKLYEELESFAYTNNEANFGWGLGFGSNGNDGPAGLQGNRSALIDYQRNQEPALSFRLQDPVCNGCANGAASIIIGSVYRGARYGGELVGSIFHGAYYDGYVRAEPVDSTGDGSLVGTTTSGMHVIHNKNVVEMVEAPDGFVYVVDHNPGTIYRLVKP